MYTGLFFNVSDTKDGVKLHLNELKFLGVLAELGFRRFDYDTMNSDFVRITDGVFIELTNKRVISTVFREYVEHLGFQEVTDENGETKTIGVEQILNFMLRNMTRMFDLFFLAQLPSISNGDLLEDSRTHKFVFFQNCFVSVSKNGFKTHNYSELKNRNKFIFVDAKLNKTFSPLHETSYFEKFCHDITGNKWNTETDKPELNDVNRLNAMLVSGGYLLHSYFESKLKL